MTQSTITRIAFGVLFALIGGIIIAIALTDSAEGSPQGECQVLYIKTDHQGVPYVQDGEQIKRWSEDIGPWVQHEVHQGYRWTRTETWRGVCEEETTTTTVDEPTTTTTAMETTTTTAQETTTTTVDPCDLATTDHECGEQPEQTPPSNTPTTPSTMPLPVPVDGPAPVADRMTLPNTGWSAGWLLVVSVIAVSGGAAATWAAQKKGY